MSISEPLRTSNPEEALVPVAVKARAPTLARLGLAVGIAALLINAFRLFAFVQDDAFITYRYAYNLRHGLGLVFNPGDHTEGYSCPLYTVLTAMLLFLPGDVLFRAKLLGVVFALGAMWAAWRLAGELNLPDWARGLVPLFLGLNSSLTLSAVDGMETALQMLLVTMAALTFVQERKRGRGWTSSLWFLAAALNRPEGALYFICALAPFLRAIRPHGFGRRETRWLTAFLVPMAVFLLWRMWYYGDWLPNTYYAKNMPLEAALDLGRGPAYVLRTLFVTLNGRVLFVAISLLLWLAALAGATSERLRGHGGIVIPLCVGAQAVVALRSGGDWMQGWRYMMPVVPLWSLLIVIALADASDAVAKIQGQAASRGVAIAGTLLLIGFCLLAAPAFRDPVDGAVSWAEKGWATSARGLLSGFKMANAVYIGDVVNEKIPAGSTIAYSEMGATPYYTPQINYLDTHGLVNKDVARLGSLGKFRTGVLGDYTDPSTDIGRLVLANRPDYLIQWMRASDASLPVLGGAYLPFARTDLPVPRDGVALAVQIWKRAR